MWRSAGRAGGLYCLFGGCGRRAYFDVVCDVVGENPDFFISYAGVNRPWAEWIAAELERAGYSTVVQPWDFRPGADFVHEMQEAASSAGRTIAVLSPAYLDSRFGEAEWRVAFAKDPTGRLGLLVPVRVQPCDPPGLLATRVYVDLVGLDEAGARRRLLAAVDRGRPRPTSAPFPGIGPRFPGLGPEVTNLPRRNPNFSGREAALARLHADLREHAVAAVVPTAPVLGLGGVGKTQLALEYAYRFGSDYDVAWWIEAERPAAALAGLLRRLGIAEAADQAQMVAGLFNLLRGRSRWLLVYDNAESPGDVTGLLPAGGDGHVLITSRWSAWSAHALSLPLDVLTRQESIAFLRERTGAGADEPLDALAELLGDLPLALDEAAAYLKETGEALEEYLVLVRNRARELFGLEPTDPPDRDHRRVATVWSVSIEKVREQAPTAEALLNLLAFLAAEVPRALPTEQPQAVPEALAAKVRDRLAYNRLVAAIGRYSLATVGPAELSLHRLVQEVIRARLGPDGERAWATTAVNVIRAAFPNDSWEVATWAECARLLPHLLAVAEHARRLDVAEETVGWLLFRASAYLRGRGQYRRARPLAEQALATTTAALGTDHLDVAWRHDELGRVLLGLGRPAEARDQYERALRIGEAELGPEHSTVCIWRSNLGGALRVLGDLAGARDQLERALRSGEASLGPNHRHVAIWRNELGGVLRDLGDLAGARDQYEQALRISEAALGPNHPDLGISHSNLGRALHDQGDLTGARDQYEQALHISEAALGPDHRQVEIIRANLSRLTEVGTTGE